MQTSVGGYATGEDEQRMKEPITYNKLQVLVDRINGFVKETGAPAVYCASEAGGYTILSNHPREPGETIRHERRLSSREAYMWLQGYATALQLVCLRPGMASTDMDGNCGQSAGQCT